MFFLDFGIQ